MGISHQRIQGCRTWKNTIVVAVKSGRLRLLSTAVRKFSHRLNEVLILDTRATNLTTTTGPTTLKDKAPSPNIGNEEDWTTP